MNGDKWGPKYRATSEYTARAQATARARAVYSVARYEWHSQVTVQFFGMCVCAFVVVNRHVQFVQHESVVECTVTAL